MAFVLLAAAITAPFGFEPSDGRVGGSFAFLSRVPGYALYLAPSEAVLVLPRPADDVLRIRLIGADAAAKIAGLEELPGKVNYFVGRDPKRWRTNVPTFAKVRAEGVYPGVDVVYYGRGASLEYDFVVAPGADPAAIRLGLRGARSVEIESSGDLVLGLGGGRIRMRKPLIYQERNGVRREVTGGYTLGGASGEAQLGFRVGRYDRRRPLVIDPILVYSTYLGGSADDLGLRIALDSAGNVYVTGRTRSLDFPTATPLQPVAGGGLDAFVTKINRSGSAILYSTYLGGDGDDEGGAIAVDRKGRVYVAGQTASTDFPTAHAFQSTFGGGVSDAFVAKLNASGSVLVYSTYLGGSGIDAALGVAVDHKRRASVTGGTDSRDFPTSNAVQSVFGGGLRDAFVTKLEAAGTSLVYSTYLGGGNFEVGRDVAVTPGGKAAVVGNTFSTNFPTANPLQPSLAGFTDAFVTKLKASGGIVYSTYLGGSAGDLAAGVAVDGAGKVYVAGGTASADFPIADAVQPVFGGGSSDAFVTKIDAAGSALVYSTFLGGGSSDAGNGIAVDKRRKVYVGGSTDSTDFPTVDPLQSTNAGLTDAFVTRISRSGTALSYSTYVGGSRSDVGTDIAVSVKGKAYLTGTTNSADFPLVEPLQPTLAGGQDGFVLKLSPPHEAPDDDDRRADRAGADPD